MIVKPFVKWAGGKTQLLPDIRKRYPVNLGGEINRYCEPFVGGGAVLWDVLLQNEIREVLINDINADLINTYVQIQRNAGDLIKSLSALQSEYLSLNIEERKSVYYTKR